MPKCKMCNVSITGLTSEKNLGKCEDCYKEELEIATDIKHWLDIRS